MGKLVPPKAPRLPAAPVEYDQRYTDSLLNTLRLYFNQLDNVNGAELTTLGGQYFNNPYAATQRTTNALLTTNTPVLITLNQNDFLNGCLNNGTDGITVNQPGIYNYQFSIQFANTDTQTHTAWVWLSIGGVNVAGTGSKFDVPSKHGSSDGYLVAACNFFVELQGNQSVSLYATTDQAFVSGGAAGIYMEAYPAQTTPFIAPSIPSVVATLSFVSALAK